jgi:hypothetical protein
MDILAVEECVLSVPLCSTPPLLVSILFVSSHIDFSSSASISHTSARDVILFYRKHWLPKEIKHQYLIMPVSVKAS